jgi:hypothetical protein
MSMFSANGSPVTNPNAAPAPGDYVDNTGTDYSGNHSSHSSSVAATDHLACTFTTVTASGGTAICQGQFAIGNSMLLAQHVPISFTQTSGPMTVNITGGTGQYQGVHGTVSVAEVPNSNNTDFTITFSK